MVERQAGLDLVLLEKQLVVIAPRIDHQMALTNFMARLNTLMDQSHGARAWILDLSTVKNITFELFGFLIGLKLALNKLQIKLDLLWLRTEAVSQELLEAIEANFELHAKGAFLISR